MAQMIPPAWPRQPRDQRQCPRSAALDVTLPGSVANCNLVKLEADPEQSVLLEDGPCASKAEALAQPQRGLEAADRAACCVERTEAAHPQRIDGVHHLDEGATEAIELPHYQDVSGP